MLTVFALKNPGRGFVLTVLSQKPGSGGFVLSVFALKNPWVRVRVDRVRSQKPW